MLYLCVVHKQQPVNWSQQHRPFGTCRRVGHNTSKAPIFWSRNGPPIFRSGTLAVRMHARQLHPLLNSDVGIGRRRNLGMPIRDWHDVQMKAPISFTNCGALGLNSTFPIAVVELRATSRPRSDQRAASSLDSLLRSDSIGGPVASRAPSPYPHTPSWPPTQT